MDWNIEFYYDKAIDADLVRRLFNYLVSRGAKYNATYKGHYYIFTKRPDQDVMFYETKLEDNPERLQACIDHYLAFDLSSASFFIPLSIVDPVTIGFDVGIMPGWKKGFIFFGTGRYFMPNERAFLFFIDLCKDVFIKFDFIYGAIKSEYMGNIPDDIHRIPEEEPYVLELYSKSMIEKIDVRKLRSDPERELTELENGGLMIYLRPKYFQEADFFYIAEPDNVFWWNFCIQGKAQKISEVTDEILAMEQKLLDIVWGFFMPTFVSYVPVTYPEDYSTGEVYSRDGRDSRHYEIGSETGVDPLEILEHFENHKKSNGKTNYIGCINNAGKARVAWNFNNDRFIGKGSGGRWTTQEYKEIDLWDYSDILNIDIYQSPEKCENMENVGPGDPAYYVIHFHTETDIWFKDDAAGKANRDRLRKVMKDVVSDFNVVSVSAQSEKLSQKELKEFIYKQD